jgi:biopolymer transport protein ExbD
MRRFSQRSHLVTLSEINITPLLDLAFVLLIIFVITTPLLEQSLSLKLPPGGRPDPPKLQQKDVRTIEISPTGIYKLNRQQLTLPQIESSLVTDFRRNTNILIYIRADEMVRAKDLYAVIDACQRNGITKYSLRTEPVTKK